MGEKASKQINEKKNSQLNSTYEPAYELDHRSINRYNRSYNPNDNRLYSPNDNRPIELSWLQQNNNRHNHHHHYHHHHENQNQRIPIAINRWSKNDKQISNENTKSFIDEYLRQ